MLQITPQMKILVAVEPADFRRGIDGLARLCRETLQHDPFVGAVFVFRNRKGTALKVLTYDGQGFWLCHKKLETEDDQTLGFTEVGRQPHNQQAGVAEAG
jgi:transposase